MSSVISATTFSERPWSGGLVKRRYEVTLEDNNLIQSTYVIGPFKVLPVDDGSSHALELLNRERTREHFIAQSNNDPLGTTLNPQWSTTKNTAKHLLYWMMRERDPYIVVYLKPLIQHIQANFNATQIANLLDITAAQVLKLNRRVNAILADTGTAETLLALFDAEQEDIT